MKHAILILAHNNFDYLNSFISIFDKDTDFFVYLHIDKKVTIDENTLKKIKKHSSVRIILRNLYVNWGGRNILQAILDLCNYAVNDLKNEEFYIHTLSGMDILTRPLSEFKQYFVLNNGKNFMEFFQLPYSGWSNGGFERLEFKHPLDRLDIYKNKDLTIYKRYIKIQKQNDLKRNLPNITFYGGSAWWSITKNAAIYLCNHFEDNFLFKRMNNVFAPDEIYPQTVLMNSHFKNNICNNSLRYISWDYGARETPAIIEEYDIPHIYESNAFFARKINTNKSLKLISFFYDYCNNSGFHFDIFSNKKYIHEIAKYVAENSLKSEIKGIISGQAGACIFLFCYSKVFKDVYIKTIAEKLLVNIIKKRKEVKNSDFNNGTIGIAFAMAWLKNQEFVNLEVDSILQDFDKCIKNLLENINKEKYINEFYKKYYRLDLYVSERNISLDIEVEKLIKWHKPYLISTLNLFNIKERKASVGLLGYSGYGLILLNKYLPPKILSSIFNI